MTAGTVKVVMPQLGESIVEATIVKWLVKAGDVVARGQTLAEIETDKATSEIPAPGAGTVRELLAREGAVVPVGQPILALEGGAPGASTGAPARASAGGAIGSSGGAAIGASPGPSGGAAIGASPGPSGGVVAGSTAGAADRSVGPSAHSDSGRLPANHLAPRGIDPRTGGPIRSSPSVRRLARRYSLDLARIDGTGKNGRVTRDDVLKAVAHHAGPTPSTPPPLPRTEATPFETALPHPIPERTFRAPPYRVQANDRVVPFSRRRQQIADHMTFSLQTAAHVVAVAEIDVSRLIAAKAKDAPAAEARGIKLTFMPYFVLHVARALGEHPELNATVVDRALVLRADKNIGVAVDTEEGLIVPVLKRADEQGLLGIARQLGELADKARAGKLAPDDISGGSFTISNPGKDGNLFGVSVIRQPEVAILRLGSIVKRAVVREIDGEDAIVVRPMMYAALSYDHRVIDGRTGNAFLHRVTELVANTRPAL